MTDLELAKENLAGHTIALCKDGKLIFSDKRGISPMMGFIEGGVDLEGYSAADLIVGKAAAMLFVKAKITAVYAQTISQSGKDFLESRGVPVTYKTLAEHIINRQGTDICPMEKAVLSCHDEEQGYILLKAAIKKLSRK